MEQKKVHKPDHSQQSPLEQNLIWDVPAKKKCSIWIYDPSPTSVAIKDEVTFLGLPKQEKVMPTDYILPCHLTKKIT